MQGQRGLQFGSLAVAVAALPLAACKPPPTDEVAARGSLEEEQVGPSTPIDSPDTSAAIWAPSETPGRALFGNPGERPLLALDCLDEEGVAMIRFTRFASADPGAGAFLAMVGNFHVVRMPVDATEIGKTWFWQGQIAADDPNLEALTGRREVTLTVPGAGMLTMKPSAVPRRLIGECRGDVLEEAELADDGQP